MSETVAETEVPEVAFKWGYHGMSRNEMGKDLLVRIQKGKHVSFADLTPGTYVYDPNKQVFIIGKLTPAKKQVEALRLGPGGQRFSIRLHSGSYSYGKFVRLSDEIVSMLDVKHEAIIAHAHQTGLDVPPIVHREYPWLFVKIPERFGIKDSAYESGFRETPQERVKQALLREGSLWGRKLPDVESMKAIIEHEHTEIEVLENTRAQAVAMNCNLSEDHDRYIQVRKNNIDFYRWLIPYVDVGGLFYIENQERTTKK